MSTDQQTLKAEIKQWERAFKEREGRNPQKEDIKKDAVIASKYKQYNAMKMKLAKAVSKPREPLTPSKSANTSFTTPQKKSRPYTSKSTHTHLNTPQKTSPLPPSSPSTMVTELGPTPQLNGRVLSIFDAITTPVKRTPSKLKAEITEPEPHFKTPTKKRLDFSQISDDEDSRSLHSSSPPVPVVHSDPPETVINSQPFETFRTPQKNMAVFQETPVYLKTSSYQTVTASPSPLASQRVRKGLTTLIAELQDIQDELKYGDYDEEELIDRVVDEDEDADVEDVDESKVEVTEDKGKTVWKKKKRKGPKRQHRLVRIHALPQINEQDGLEGEDLREHIQKIANTQKEETVLESDESEEWSDGGSEYIRKNLDFSNVKGKKAAGYSRNFKAYKIKKRGGNKNWGKRAKGW